MTPAAAAPDGDRPTAPPNAAPTDLLKSASVYLDSSPSIAADADTDPDPDPDLSARPNSLEPAPAARPTRAERLAAEQAAWVRDKFDLLPSEHVVASFSAALVRNILIQGRIHITTSHLCFYAKIFGRVTKELVPFRTVARVKKRRGGFVANAIKIYLTDPEAQPLVIGSLNHRARAFSIIQARLREVNPASADAAEAPAAHNHFAPREEDDTSDDRSLDDAHHTLSRESSLPPPAPPAQPAQAQVQVPVPVSAAPTPAEPPLVWRGEGDPVDRMSGKAFERRCERARVVLPAPVAVVFNVLFLSSWLKEYHASTNNRDVEFREWYRATDGLMTRDVSFRRPLAYKIGPKETRVNEVQRYSYTSAGGVVVEIEGRNLDAPYGDYFVVESFFEMTPVEGEGDGDGDGDGEEGSGAGEEKTLLVLSVAVHFNKSTILKGKIENGALTETKKAFQQVADMAAGRIAEYNAAGPRRRREITGDGGYMRTDDSDGDVMIVEQAGAGAVAQAEAETQEAEAVRAGTVQREGAAGGGFETGPGEHARTNGYIGVPPPAAVRSQTVVVGKRDAEMAGACGRLEVSEAMWSQWTRGAAVGALGVACVLLLVVALLLVRVCGKLAQVERLLAAAQQAGARCVAEGAGAEAAG